MIEKEIYPEMGQSNYASVLSEKVFWGRLFLYLDNREIRMLRLILGEKESRLKHWEELWHVIDAYDDIPFSCKELMPLAVKKMQELGAHSNWKSYCGKHADFLIGLPKYAWTKNKLILFHAKQILQSFASEKIEAIPIKGLAEMIANESEGLFRTSRDLDILVKTEDLHNCKAVLEKMGWKQINKGDSFLGINLTFIDHALAFSHPDIIVELDLHIAPFAIFRKEVHEFSKEVFERKISIEEGLFIPSLIDQLVITLVNANYLFNWKTGQYAKYIFDALKFIEVLSLEEQEILRKWEKIFWKNEHKVDEIQLLKESILNLPEAVYTEPPGKELKGWFGFFLLDNLLRFNYFKRYVLVWNKNLNWLRLPILIVVRSFQFISSIDFVKIRKKGDKQINKVAYIDRLRFAFPNKRE